MSWLILPGQRENGKIISRTQVKMLVRAALAAFAIVAPAGGSFVVVVARDASPAELAAATRLSAAFSEAGVRAPDRGLPRPR